MNKFVTSALALAVVGSLAYAGTGDKEWSELDREITNLSSSLANSQDGGMGWSVLMRITGSYSDDELFTGGPTDDDLFGFSFEDVDLAFWGSVGDYSWRVSMDVGEDNGDGNGFVLEDGYVSWDCGDLFTASMGRHKANTLMSSSTNPEHLLFINRSALGVAFDVWDEGVAAAGSFEEMFSWSVSVQNNPGNRNTDNGDSADHRYTLRVEYQIGEGSGEAEGALGAGPDLAATIGLTYLDDDAQDAGDDNDLWAIDVRGTAGPIGFGGEIADVGDDLELGTDDLIFFADEAVAAGSNVGGAMPYDLYVSYLIQPDLEGGIRYEDFDNFDDTTILTVGVSWFQSGHNAKWQIGYSDVDSDINANEGSIWQVGVVVGSSG